MKIFAYCFLLTISLVNTGCNGLSQSLPSGAFPLRDTIVTNKPKVNPLKLGIKSKQALSYCKKKGMNAKFCILIDMSLHSGVNRFFVWDFKGDSVKYSFVVGHGCCDNQWSSDETKNNPSFSNIDGSHCSSLGKYKIGKRAYSEWGVNIKYIMHGLETTNSNAKNRLIVFHAWDEVTDNEVYPLGTIEGWGCPTLSNNNFKLVDPMIKTSPRPVLMWIYKD